MLEINLNQLTRLRDALSRSHGFDDLLTFRSLFVDPRIARWRNRIPVASTPAACVDALIATLCDLANDYGENALILFLRVLFEHTPDGDLHDDLGQLIAELEITNPSVILTVPLPPDSAGSATTPAIPSSTDPTGSAATLLNRAEEPPTTPFDAAKLHKSPPPSPLLEKKYLLVVLAVILVVVAGVLVYLYLFTSLFAH